MQSKLDSRIRGTSSRTPCWKRWVGKHLWFVYLDYGARIPGKFLVLEFLENSWCSNSWKIPGTIKFSFWTLENCWKSKKFPCTPRILLKKCHQVYIIIFV